MASSRSRAWSSGGGGEEAIGSFIGQEEVELSALALNDRKKNWPVRISVGKHEIIRAV